MCLRILGLSLIFWDFAFLVFSVWVLTCAAHISWAKSNHVAKDTNRRRKRIPLGIGGSFPYSPEIMIVLMHEPCQWRGAPRNSLVFALIRERYLSVSVI